MISNKKKLEISDTVAKLFKELFLKESGLKIDSVIYGSFENIEIGWSEKALNDLTGCPYYGVGVEDPE